MPARPVIKRWIAFNAVGLIGIVVQLGAFAVLLRFAQVPLAMATILAVEAAILHNFFWHQRWTWRDRPVAGSRELGRRLVRFHAVNGLVSLAGNVMITTALTQAGVHPLAANAAAIATCSLVNFAAGHLLVFRAPAALALGLGLGAPLPAAAQPAAALEGWQAYVANVEKRHANPNGGGFFALDARRVSGWRERARAGEVPMTEVEPPAIDDGKMHHWAGAIYVPKTTVAAVVKRLQDHAGRESQFYEEVKASKLLERNGDTLRVFLRLYRDAGPVEATYNTEHAVEYRMLSPTRATNRSVSTKIAELDDPGTPAERELSPRDDSGFLWRLNAYWRYEQFGDGVLIECESVSLSRSVPWVVRPLVGPIANRIARESLARTLRSLRAFLRSP